MGADPSAQRVVDDAWRRFAEGDLPGALALARDAAEANVHLVAASAALGYFLMQAGRIDEASQVLLPARERAPTYAPVHWYTGYLLQSRGDRTGAAQAFARACELDARLDEAAYALAWTLNDLGRVEEAARWSARALAKARSPQRLLQMGWLQQEQGLFAAAVRSYREAIDAFAPSAPQQPRLHLHLSQCLERLKQDDESAAVLRRALGQWPQDMALRSESIRRLRQHGDPDGALRQAHELVRRNADQAAAWHLLGVLQQDAADLEAADESFRRCQELDPGLTDALVRRARIQGAWGRFDGAKWLLGLVLHQSPDDEAALDLQAQLLLDVHEDESARRLLLRRLRVRRDSADRWRLLAVVQWRRDRGRMALRWVRRALKEARGDVEALRVLGWLALEQGDPAQAVDAVQRLLQRMPEDSAAQVQAAFVFERAGQVDQAQVWAERAVARSPGQADAWRALSQVRLRQRRWDEAEAAIQQALRIAPAQPDSLRQLGWVHMGASRYGQAQLAFLRTVESRPGDHVSRLELAQALCRAGHFGTGLQALDGVLRERPGWPAALLIRAQLMVEGGGSGAFEACAQLLRADRHSPEAVKTVLRLAGLGETRAQELLAWVPVQLLRAAWREAVVRAIHTQGQAYLARLLQVARACLDEDPWIAAAGLYAASLSARSDASALTQRARAMYRGLKIRAGQTRLPSRPQPAPGDRKPRIAYVADQLHQSLLRRVLAAHDANRSLVFLFSNQSWAGIPSHVQVQPLVLETLAESCAANCIDVVIDTGGLHPFEGQFELLRAYARRLAPVQIGWLGCWGSAGGVFDMLLADEVSVPPAQEATYEEAVLRLTGGQWCWDPPVAAPEVSPPPLLARGTVTYGVTARGLRLDDDCLDEFARVAAATSQSVIRFIGEVAGDWPQRRRILSRMQARGVEAGRVFFDPPLPYGAYLAWFNRVDVVLDSFPGNGGLSLLDPLWMGVPVVTLAGAWAGARQGASLLAALGLSEWVADDREGFCTAAVALVQDRDRLSRHRAGLRARILASPLVDGRRVASQIEDLCIGLKQGRAAAAVEPGAKARTRAYARLALDDWLARPRAIDLTHVKQDAVPDLSVIVVLFNQAGLSRRTLQALADQRGARFETIVVDNASSDRTPELLDRLRGARIIRNPENIGFLRAARQGAAAARGRYLAFLNSDAILQDDALAAALRAIQSDPGIGALGGRVVLTDGGLQEAGNTVFNDGSAGGIGRGEDAFGHAALAARTTDYVSGVFLLTPASLWRMLGGFDEAFAPAYYEDTDYCLRVWQAGFRVVYEPTVLLEHLEWGSATDNSAVELMERNREVFCARHAAWLRGQPDPQVLPLDGDRWRSPQDQPRRPRVLIVENEVPHMFKGGGLPRARLLLQALRDWPVTLFPLWVSQDEWRAVYASLPKNVEVALGHGLGGLEAFLERRRGVYDVLLVSRPPNLEALGPLRARRPELFAGMRLVYDAEALFALRDIAMAGVKGRPIPRVQARARIAAEVALAADASDVMTVSQRDARYFGTAGYRTHILSHSIAARRDAPGVARRSGLLFVGALHPGTPNEDGLLWFIREVMPLLRGRMAAAPVLSVVGVCLSDAVAAQAGPHVKILGAQPALEPHYDAARVFVAPVRFAGGVPVKVIEAAANGIPVVASALLARQLDWREGLDILGARDAGALAAAIARLLTDDAAWQRQQLAAWEQCARRYDPDLFGRTLRRVLGGPSEAAGRGRAIAQLK